MENPSTSYIFLGLLLALCWGRPNPGQAEDFSGRYYSGRGDHEYLKLLDDSRAMFEANPVRQNLSMLYTPQWNGLVEGPMWGSWWVQNSYGPTFCSLPFLAEPYLTFLQNSQDNWFKHMGDGKTRRFVYQGIDHGLVPDGHLCDCANPASVIYKQGDGNTAIHDWPVEFTAAGGVMQSELLLIGREAQAIQHYLPLLERSAGFVESRRDSRNNLFLLGPAGNLLAPSHGGRKMADGTWGPSCHAGLSITYIAFLDRLIELEKLAQRPEQAKLYQARRKLARKGLRQLVTNEGYFIASREPNGTKHGVYGAPRHGYFEATCNHDALCFRVADDRQARKIYQKIASLPQLRPHDFIIPNYPAYDDMYTTEGIFAYGTWVNGGHWSTCEARMIMGYYRVGAYEDIRKSMRRLDSFAANFQLDNPLRNFGRDSWFEDKLTNLTYDAFGPPAAMVRGLFEYIYSADTLTLIPHLPPTITALEQKFPIRFGTRQIYLSTSGVGTIKKVVLNGVAWPRFNKNSVWLPYDQLPPTANILIIFGDGAAPLKSTPSAVEDSIRIPAGDDPFWNGNWFPVAPKLTGHQAKFEQLKRQAESVRKLHEQLSQAGLGATSQAAHAREALRAIAALHARMEKSGSDTPAPFSPEKRYEIELAYLDAALNLCNGLVAPPPADS